jgi:hypothetical protein
MNYSWREYYICDEGGEAATASPTKKIECYPLQAAECFFSDQKPYSICSYIPHNMKRRVFEMKYPNRTIVSGSNSCDSNKSSSTETK